ncbi:gluconate 2-dehydrogenase subunit 3 family protein [Paenibacillus sp. GD4]|uniref:gluconate 2-dehydrogenase subunit 3 family protein n=1 Tax=Paenibacillus sp. GD4 TaxID=3068890 RepID=UPI00279676AB|nr:gluconate 2-dehydrogenase subunit 3 family protein [Paenibacillus sp. GD4]MDQ1914019.1 gluconate 2-dehydrogenase subunit 3 family protein [Paenibacillus sp. GD4]
MSEYKVHYPEFDVLDQEEHWDPHTREIVKERLETDSFYSYRFFNPQEAETLIQLCSILLDDRRDAVMAYMVYHFDKSLHAGIGESERKAGVPKQSILLREGLAQFDQACRERYGGAFTALEDEAQNQAVSRFMQGDISSNPGPHGVSMEDFRDKLFAEAVAAYYSHPFIWSEIGYAGPAYPRGYVRSEMGLTDPWEAKRDGN